MKGLRTYRDAVALVTGGGSGIGRALSEELSRRGAQVIVADIRPEAAEETAAAVQKAGGRASAAKLDVRDYSAFDSLAGRIWKDHGRLDYFFNNAGTGVFGDTRFSAPEDWDLTIDVNLRGVASGIQAVYPRMVEQRFGHIVNTASIAGLVPFPLFTAYSATKHAVVALSTTLRVEARRFDVQVSALCPGAIRTPLLTGGAFGRPLGDVSDARMLEWWQRVFPIEVDVLACKALDAVARNRAIIVIPRWIKILWWFWRINPDLGRFLLQADFDQSLKKFPEFTKPPSKGR